MAPWIKALIGIASVAESFKIEIAQLSIKNALAKASHHFHEDFIPIVSNVQAKVVPAAHDYLTNHVVPTIKVSIDKTVFHLQEDIAPAIHEAAIRVGEHVNDEIIPSVKDGVDGVLFRVREKLGRNLEKIPRVIFETADEAQAWVAKNPWRTAIIVTSGVVLFAPGLVTGPALWAAGFGAEGVGAGSVAAGVHAGIGDVAAGSYFAILQSAGAGGSGAVVVEGIIKATAFIALVYNIAVSLREEETEDKVKDRQVNSDIREVVDALRSSTQALPGF